MSKGLFDYLRIHLFICLFDYLFICLAPSGKIISCGLMWYTIYMKLTKNDIEKWSKHWDYESNDAVQTAQELYQAKRYHHASKNI